MKTYFAFFALLSASFGIAADTPISFDQKLSGGLLSFWKTGYSLTSGTLNADFQLAPYPTITVKNSAGENWSTYDALLLDVYNSSADPLQIYLRVDDSLTGNGLTGSRTGRTFAQPRRWSTVAFPLRLRPADYGMKALPGLQGSEWLTMNNGVIDLTHIWRWMLYLENPVGPTRPFKFANARLAVSGTDFTNMIDPFGQYSRTTWTGKVADTSDLLAKDQAESLDLIANPNIAGFDSRGAWGAGPQKGAFSRFYTAKFNNKWWFVSPEGKLFLSFGMGAVGTHHETVTQGREYMFQQLPSGGDPLTAFYDRNDAGLQTYSFYPANLFRKWGNAWVNTAKARQIDRMKSWGFNTLGGWCDIQLWRTPRVPYTVEVDLSGTFKTLTVDPARKRFPDPFDPAFRTAVVASIATQPLNAINDPWCLGWFIDNEPTIMGAPSSEESGRYGIAYAAMKMDLTSPAKVQLMNKLKNRYGTIATLNTAWGTSFASWSVLEAPITLAEPSNAARKTDFAEFCLQTVREYFRVMKESLRAVDANVLYLGCRFFRYSTEALQAAGSYCNVVSFNVYAPQLATSWNDLAWVNKPFLVSEFHFGATDAGMFHPGLCQVPDQASRGTAYTNYVRSMADSPLFVGCHWFQYMDEPVTGRETDGENYNIGFVSVGDVPYAPLVQAARAVHAEAYARRYNQ